MGASSGPSPQSAGRRIAAVMVLCMAMSGCAAEAAETVANAATVSGAAQQLTAFDWQLLASYDAGGNEQSNWFSAGTGTVKLSFSTDGVLSADQGCTIIGGNYTIAGSHGLAFQGYSIAGAICTIEQKWRIDRLIASLMQVQRYQFVPRKGQARPRLQLGFADGSRWELVPLVK